MQRRAAEESLTDHGKDNSNGRAHVGDAIRHKPGILGFLRQIGFMGATGVDKWHGDRDQARWVHLDEENDSSAGDVDRRAPSTRSRLAEIAIGPPLPARRWGGMLPRQQRWYLPRPMWKRRSFKNFSVQGRTRDRPTSASRTFGCRRRSGGNMYPMRHSGSAWIGEREADHFSRGGAANACEIVCGCRKTCRRWSESTLANRFVRHLATAIRGQTNRDPVSVMPARAEPLTGFMSRRPVDLPDLELDPQGTRLAHCCTVTPSPIGSPMSSERRAPMACPGSRIVQWSRTGRRLWKK